MLKTFKKLFVPGSNCSDVTHILLQELSVNVTEISIIEKLESHPDFPSLLSISDILKEFGIDNICLKVPEGKLPEIEGVFITKFSNTISHSESFVVVKQIIEGTVTFYNPETCVIEKMAVEAFEKSCSHIVLIPEVSKTAGEPEFRKRQAIERKKLWGKAAGILFLPIMVSIMCAIYLAKDGTQSILPIINCFLMLAGSLVGCLLFLFEIDQFNPAIQEICSGGKKINCAVILNSKASKIVGINWSIIGFSYFTGGLFLQLTMGLTAPSTLAIISLLNVISCPFIFYSVYYQWRIAKQWCLLCLITQAILASQFFISFTSGWYSAVDINYINIVLVTLCYGLPFIMSMMLVPLFKDAKDSKKNKRQLIQLKNNPDIFRTLFGRERSFSHSTDGLGIVLGDPNAPNKILKICNPYCSPCASAHSAIDQLIDMLPNDVQVQIIYNVSTNELGTLPVKHLMAIASKANPHETKKGLDGWFLSGEKNYETFSKEFPIDLRLLENDSSLDAMYKWCKLENITYTPTIFVNGYELPKTHSISDLKYLFP